MLKKLQFNLTLFLLLGAMIAGPGSWAQTTIFSENIGSTGVSGTTTIASHTFQNSGTLTFTGTGDVRNNTNSSGYTGSSAGNNVFITSSSGTFFQISGINTSNFSSISLSFGQLKTTTAGNNELVVEVSSDGTNYSSLTYTRPTGSGTANWRLIEPTGSIPSTSNLRIRFRQTSTSTQWRLDDIILRGTSTPAGATAALAGTLSETNISGGTATVTLTGDMYAASLTTAGFTLNNAPSGVTLSGVTRTSGTVATLTFAYNNTDFDTSVTNFNVTVATSQLATSASAITTNNITIAAVSETLTPSPATLTGLNYNLGSGPSTAQSFTVSGTNLQSGGGTITVTAPSNFEVSTTSATTGFGPSANLTYTGTGTFAANTVWVRLISGLSAGAYTQSVTLSGGKASNTVSVSGNVVPPPPANDDCTGAVALTLNAAAVTGTFQNATQSLAAVTCETITGNADDDVWYSFTTTTAGNYTITVDGGENLDVVIDLRSGACNGTNIACMDDFINYDEVLTQSLSAGTTYYVRVYEYGALSGLSEYNFTIGVEKELAAPVATDATDITTTSFTANWDAAADATSYRLDVSTSSTFGESTTTESFTGTTFPPTGWTGSGWTRSTNASDYNTGPAAASATSTNGSLTTASYASPISLSFYLGRSTNATAKTLTVEVSTTSQSSGFTTVATFDHNNVPSGSYDQYTVDLSDYAGQSTVYIRFTKTSTTTSPWRLDDIAVTTQQNLFVTGYNNRTVSGTSEEVTGLTAGTDYYYRVRAVNGITTSANSNSINAETGRVNTWNGTAWSEGTPPAIIDDAVINGNYATGTNGTFTAGELSVTSGTLTISSGTALTIDRELTVSGGSVNVQSNGHIIQIDETATNTGAITVRRNSSELKRLDYTLWSSPVAAQNLKTFSPQTDNARFYNYNTQSNNYNSVSNPVSVDFAQGRGYLIRMPNNHPTTATIWEGVFTGVPYNGSMNIPVTINTTDANESYNALGNPYASAINADDFIAANTTNIDGTLYFWRKTNGSATDAYVTYNAVLGGNSTNPEVDDPNGIIQVGQGFIVRALPTAANVVFNNAMREANFDNQFFRMGSVAQATPSTPERHRIWINMTNSEGVFSQALIGYAQGATNGIDMGIDSNYLSNNTAGLYTVVSGSRLALQGRVLPFDITDAVPVGYKAATAGSYTIALDHADGLFAGGQEIFIKDNATGTIYNLADGGYNFSTDAGVFETRFEVVYQNQALDVENPTLTAESIAVYKQDSHIAVSAGAATITGIAVYDMRGRMLYNNDAVNATETTIETLAQQQQVLIVQVTTGQGTVSKKIIY